MAGAFPEAMAVFGADTFTLSDRVGSFSGVLDRFSVEQTIEIGGGMVRIGGKMLAPKSSLSEAPVIGKLLTIGDTPYRIVHFDEDALSFEIYLGSKNR